MVSVHFLFYIKAKEKLKTAPLTNIVDCSSWFPIKWICYIAFGSAPSGCCLLKSIAIILLYFLK